MIESATKLGQYYDERSSAKPAKIFSDDTTAAAYRQAVEQFEKRSSLTVTVG